MIPQHIRKLAHRIAREHRSATCQVYQEGRFYFVDLDDSTVKLGKATTSNVKRQYSYIVE